MKNITYISVELEDRNRPSERPPKTNWKIEMIKKSLKAFQYASPRKTAEIVWHYFTMPGKVRFTEPQLELIGKAEQGELSYKGDRIVTYRWGANGPKVLLCHGWRSKSADFRRFVEAYLEAGFVVESFDMRAHGQSAGKHTAMPEYVEILKDFIGKNGPYHTVVGYSIGGIASGIAISELGAYMHPVNQFFIAAPPYIRYFFKDLIADVGLNTSVYEKMAAMVEENYHKPIDYFDLRTKTEEIAGIEKHFIYCEDDETIPFEKGMELFDLYPGSHFVQARGFGHYKIIAHEEIINYVVSNSQKMIPA
jgi:pimeloyl-ACP methyl ester carboxylesterase